jgi:hypothetical protein
MKMLLQIEMDSEDDMVGLVQDSGELTVNNFLKITALSFYSIFGMKTPIEKVSLPNFSFVRVNPIRSDLEDALKQTIEDLKT